ncbi:ATP-binding cassette domain-containing protein [Ramlibacter sp. G-1-2-2]|uniref:ATP-binding cassette domain-containing protein n=1 Tax=Ramlibacter agri TaxID=2728837 RepID=A0A848GXE9_9BURK|nr:oligopeptide/dipeptide ABC transporter ATP-binding protein [Ramlibacter agri]NML42827.1 ATP-binding cassette domain-containing protein [Ramlibacter agri]
MNPVLQLDEVRKHYPGPRAGWIARSRGVVKAVDGASAEIERGTSFALAGESGSGKSTLARMILRLEQPSAGSIRFEGREVAGLAGADLAWYRSRVQAVFQDASGSLDPRMRIGAIVAEPLEIQRAAGGNKLTKQEMREKVQEMLKLVGLPQRVFANYPHELSGGQKQRVAIARAMVLEPALVVLDEPVSALDVSIRAQVLNLLADFQDRLGLSYFLISHDLATLGHVSTRMAVMYLGRIIETGSTDEIYARPLHPYTRALFAAMPVAEPGRVKPAPAMRGEIGSALDLPRGCRFCPRCELAQPVCREVDPPLVQVDAQHAVACHLAAPSLEDTGTP